MGSIVQMTHGWFQIAKVMLTFSEVPDSLFSFVKRWYCSEISGELEEPCLVVMIEVWKPHEFQGKLYNHSRYIEV